MVYVTRQDDISVLPLSRRAMNCLRRTDIHSVGAMMDYPENEFIAIHNMGKKSVEEILLVVRELNGGTGELVLIEADERLAEEEAAEEEGGGREIPIENLPLSVRAKHCLAQGGYTVASQLVGITYEQLMNMWGMGKKTAEEVFAYLEKERDLMFREVCAGASGANAFEHDLAAEMYSAYGKTASEWLREVLKVKAAFPEARGESFVYRLYENGLARGAVKETIIRMTEENGDEISRAVLRSGLPRHLDNTTILEEILLELEAASAIELGENMIYRQYPTIVEFAASIKDDRNREVIQGRIEGKTLQEIGDQYRITRERVRQLMQKGLQKRPYLREDKYAYVYDHYDFSLEDFTLAFNEPRETYYYLEMISPTARARRKPLEEILTDRAIPPELRKKAERAVYKQYISEDGVRVKKARSELVKHFVKVYCKELTEYDDFFQKYHEWLEVLGLGDDPALAIESRTYENKLNQCDYVLWNQWRSFRYYNIPEREFDELLSTLDLERFEGVELSTLKLFRDYPDLMRRYDIRDEYELHNLLKKVWPAERSNVNFKKMPTIEIGSADPASQLLNLLLQYAPISADDLAERYEEEYGVKARTVRGGFLRELDAYFYKGMYSVDYAAMPLNQLNRMKAVLDRDFYTIQEAKQLYKREFPTSDESLLNPYTMKSLDFHVYPGYSGYIVKNSFSGATEYFRTILTQNDLVDMREYNAAIRYIATYESELLRLRGDYKIVEFAPLRYINIRRLNVAGVTKESLKNYCVSVANRYEKGEYFTITSLRNDGFVHEMDDLGFDEWFYGSVLLEDKERFSYQRIGGTRIFLCGKAGANLGDMLVWLLEARRKIDFYDLMNLLERDYGIALRRDKLLTILGGTELYYDAIMEAVYIDYDTYFEEI